MLSTIALILVGAVLLLFGAALSVYGVALLGATLGGGAGYLYAERIGDLLSIDGVVATVVAVLIGIAIGVIIAYAALSIAIAIMSFGVGVFFGLTVVAPALVDGPWYVDGGVALGVGLVLALISVVLTKTILILVTAAAGAAITSGQLGMSDLEAAQAEVSLDPVTIEVTAPIFVGLFILGLLTQIGLFKLGYVRTAVRQIPGMSVVRDRTDRVDRQ